MHSNIINQRYVLVAENWTYKDFLQALAIAVHSKPPKKLASISLLSIAWKLDWLNYKITGKRRQLTKQVAKSISTETQYNNDKIKTALNYEFKAIDKTITSIGAHFLNRK